MRRWVLDLATGKRELVRFEPVSVNRPFTASSYDYQLDLSKPIKDHRRPDFPRAFLLNQNPDDVIYSHDVSDISKKVSSNPCLSLPRGFKRNGEFCKDMLRAYSDVCQQKDSVEAIRQLHAAHARLTRHGYSSAMADDDIRRLADTKSRQFLKSVRTLPTVNEQFEKVVELLADLGLAFTEAAIKKATDNDELFSLVNRALDENWLVRQLRRKCAYEVEQVARDLALVQRSKQIYCSDFSLNRHRDRRNSNDIALDNTVAFDEDNPDNWFTLKELSDKSVSNPSLRRGEMFVRLRGFEEIAQESGHDAVFITTTAPSRFHAVSKGSLNQNWIDAGKPDAKCAHQHLMSVWQQLGKTLAQHDIKLYGMRIVEPHQDGTPHHHLLLFLDRKHTKFVVSEFRRLSLKDSPKEAGASQYRFKCEHIDWSKGSAVGYVAKYVSKNIDGAHISSDKGSNLNGLDAAERVVTWSRLNNIRQFQFIGGPSVTVWRELRRLREEFQEDDAMLTDLSEPEHFLLEKVRRSADEGDWKAFCYAMGGVLVKRKDQTVKVQYSVPDTIQKLLVSGEFTPTRFGDMAQARVNGLLFRDIFLATRFRRWKVENKEQFLRAQRGIMTNVVDYFDALEREQEYQRMADERYHEYEQYVQRCEELQALIYSGHLEIDASSSVGAAPPDWMH
ncbi:replication endonuclease [Vibrio sp. S4M6]|uniref:replication endonuclease n=1 Tax=Vibrio sinus TaxID=2946865 RepID=UPI002029D6EE|nr:replication endonuclease [Vibrio sinus]MCL9783234.1 replication endonuclease [Vibrio sinus]